MKSYELIEQETGVIVKRTNEDGSESWIPADESNVDYQEYLRSLEDESEASK